VFAGLEEALEAQAIDLVILATPSGMHARQALTALEAGAHVVVEKPLDVSVAEGRRVVEAAERTGLTVSVVSQHRFDPSSEAVRAAIERGDLGRLTSAVMSAPLWRSQEYYDSGAWRGTWALDGGGVLINQGVHTVDLLLWMMGRPDTVSAEVALLAHDGIEVEDTVVATIVFASGALGAVHATTAANGTLTSRLQVHGSAGSAVIEGDELVYASEGIVQHDAGSSHERQYLDLLAAIDEGRPPRVSAGEALWALATVRAVYLSATLGERIRVADVIAGAYDGVETRVPRR
jgi:predicted dehydrogenase